jgi:anti-sigma regulatory factor (Ser/Thr protein kinase)
MGEGAVMTASAGPGDGRQAGAWHIAVGEPLDVFVARWAVQRIASQIGFSRTAAHELAIVVSELCTNILKYGVRGEVAVRRLDDPAAGPGLEIVAEDEGPPLADFGMALRDGWGDRAPIDPAQLRRGGIGAGLGAIQRLTDSFEYCPGGVRKAFRVTRYLRRQRRGGS